MKQILTLLVTCTTFSSFSQSATEIFLFDMKIINGQVHVSNGINITRHKGYDNQPFFHPLQPIIYYSSFDDSDRSDIKFNNYSKQQTSNFTVTRDRGSINEHWVVALQNADDLVDPHMVQAIGRQISLKVNQH